jgi:hypothetical protein
MDVRESLDSIRIGPITEISQMVVGPITEISQPVVGPITPIPSPRVGFESFDDLALMRCLILSGITTGVNTREAALAAIARQHSLSGVVFILPPMARKMVIRTPIGAAPKENLVLVCQNSLTEIERAMHLYSVDSGFFRKGPDGNFFRHIGAACPECGTRLRFAQDHNLLN